MAFAYVIAQPGLSRGFFSLGRLSSTQPSLAVPDTGPTSAHVASAARNGNEIHTRPTRRKRRGHLAVMILGSLVGRYLCLGRAAV